MYLQTKLYSSPTQNVAPAPVDLVTFQFFVIDILSMNFGEKEQMLVEAVRFS